VLWLRGSPGDIEMPTRGLPPSSYGDLLRQHAADQPEATAYTFLAGDGVAAEQLSYRQGGCAITFAELDGEADRLAELLIGLDR
jgi:acyl-CoA synthetase (AMP-forming)/AMP-acid ligase II